MTKLMLALAVALAVGGCKNKDAAPAAETSKADKATPKPAEQPAAPATSVDAAQLAGTWTKSDNAEVHWTFNADGTTHTKTSVTEFDGTFELKGTALTMKPKDMAASEYIVLEASATKLRLKDAKYNDVVELKK